MAADEAFTSRLDIQVARIDGNTAAIVTESTTRASADGALSTRLDAVFAIADGNTAAIVAEQTARATADEASAVRIDALSASLYDPNDPDGLVRARAAIVDERTARVTADSAQAMTIDGLTARVGTTESDIITERQVRADADGALSTRIDSVSAKADGYGALIVTEQQARADGDSAQARRTDLLIAQTDSDRTFLQNLSGQTDADRLFLQGLKAQTDSDRAYFLSEQTARINQDGAFAQQLEAVVASVAGNTSAVSRIDTAISDIYTAQAQTNIDLYARTDAGTAFGRFGMRAVSGPSGVMARLEALIAVERGGQTYGAGMTFDLLPGGGSLVRFDADKFVITSPGVSGVPAFSFDAGSGTLTVPYLRLLSQQASTPLRIDIGSYTLIAGAGTVNDQIDANLNFTYLVTNPDFPANIEVFGKLTISGPAGTSLLGMRLIVDGTVAGYFKFNEQNVSVSVGPNNNTFDFRASCIRYLAAGTRSVRIQYTYTSPGAGQVQINELHLAGFQPKA